MDSGACLYFFPEHLFKKSCKFRWVHRVSLKKWVQMLKILRTIAVLYMFPPCVCLFPNAYMTPTSPFFRNVPALTIFVLCDHQVTSCMCSAQSLCLERNCCLFHSLQTVTRTKVPLVGRHSPWQTECVRLLHIYLVFCCCGLTIHDFISES